MMTLDLLLALFTGIFAIVVVFAKNPLVSAFSLLITFLGIAGVYYQLGALFLTAVQILVYAGAIAILFIFVLMLMNLSEYKTDGARNNIKPYIGFVLVMILFAVFAFVIDENIEYLNFGRVSVVPMRALFEKLFTTYLVPFELATMLLLGSIVAAVLISKRYKKPERV